MEKTEAEELVVLMMGIWSHPAWPASSIAAYQARLEEMSYLGSKDSIKKLADELDSRPSLARIVKANRGSQTDRAQSDDAKFKAKWREWQAEELRPLTSSEYLKYAKDLRVSAADRVSSGRGVPGDAFHCYLSDMALLYEENAEARVNGTPTRPVWTLQAPAYMDGALSEWRK